MYLVMFDIDGTLVESTAFDSRCYKNALEQELKIIVSDDWTTYKNITDTGLLIEILENHNIQTQVDNVIEPIQKRFFAAIQKHLDAYSIDEIAGASNFLEKLRERKDIHLAMATGGWKLSAEMKLRAAGIDYSDIPLCTSDDHHTRIGIMQKAESSFSTYKSKTYFGDAIWDKNACTKLKYDFIAIGNKVNHSQRYQDFSAIDFDQFVKSLIH